MKKKVLLILGVLVAAVVMITACTNSSQQQKPTATGSTSMVNPMVKYENEAEVVKKLGHDIGTLPKSTRFEIHECNIIDNRIADLRYVRDDKAEAFVRTERNVKEDISGVQNVNYTKGEYNGHPYFLGDETIDKVQVAYFIKEDNGTVTSYSMSANGIDKENFLDCFKSLMDSVYN